MIETFYGEHGDPQGAAEDAHRKFAEWYSRQQDVEILHISTAACGTFGEASCLGFWLTVIWRWSGNLQRWRIEGVATAATIALHELEKEGQIEPHTRSLLKAALGAYEDGKREQRDHDDRAVTSRL